MSSRNDEHFTRRYGPWALIVGGSNGIGAEFARQLAARGLNLLLVGRRSGAIEGLAAELAGEFGIGTATFASDVSTTSGLDALIEYSNDFDIGLLVANAALSVVGSFLDQPVERHRRLLSHNCAAPLELSYEFGSRLRKRGSGGIILLSSMASFQGTALTAHYAASKAYVRLLAEGLWEELRPFGVDVLASCPGTVRTPTFLKDHPVNRPLASLPVMECEPTVGATLRALGKRPVVVPGAIDRIVAFFMQRVLPRRILIRMTAGSTRAMYPEAAEGVLPVGEEEDAAPR